jgi:hypothetical protein
MHPTTVEYLVKVGQDDARRADERGRLLLEARRARRPSARQSARPAPGLPPAGRKRTSTARRMRPTLAAGAAAAMLALTASADAAASPGETAAVPVSARHPPADNRFTELLALSQVKRHVAWASVQRARVRRPQTGTSRFTDQQALSQVKRQASWKAVHRAAGR